MIPRDASATRIITKPLRPQGEGAFFVARKLSPYALAWGALRKNVSIHAIRGYRPRLQSQIRCEAPASPRGLLALGSCSDVIAPSDSPTIVASLFEFRESVYLNSKG